MEKSNLLKEVYKCTQSGMEATKAVLPKVEDKNLMDQIEKQSSFYRDLAERTEDELKKEGMLPKEPGAFQKATMWGAIKLSTLADTSSGHIAEIMINGTNMGVIDMTKRLNDDTDASLTERRFAYEYIKGEEKHIEELKSFL